MSATATQKSERLYEVAYSSDLKVDREAGVIRGVKILGRESKNGRTYSEAAMREAAGFYDGIGVNVDHDRTGTDRRLADRFGFLENVRVKTDGVYGDLQYLKAHPLAEPVAEAAQRMPRQLGLSHNAEGVVAQQDGKLVVETVTHVFSVDLVNSPATVAGLFESETEPIKVAKTLREIVEKAPKENKLAVRLKEQMDAGMVSPDLPVDVEAGDSVAEEVLTAFETAAIKIIKDRSLSPEERADKVKALLQQAEEAAQTAGGGGDTDSAADVPESVTLKLGKLQEELRQLRARDEARSLLESADIEATDARVAALMGVKDAETKKSLLEDWPTRSTAMQRSRPASSPPARREPDAIRYPESYDGVVASLR